MNQLYASILTTGHIGIPVLFAFFDDNMPLLIPFDVLHQSSKICQDKWTMSE